MTDAERSDSSAATEQETCPHCGASSEKFVEKPAFAKPRFRTSYCGKCGNAVIGGETA